MLYQLRNGFLIDPTELRSVHIWALEGRPALGITTALPGSEMTCFVTFNGLEAMEDYADGLDRLAASFGIQLLHRPVEVKNGRCTFGKPRPWSLRRSSLTPSAT